MGEERTQAEFNSSLEYLRRINMGFSMCAEASINLNGYSWASSLAWIFRELSTQMKENEKAELETEIYSLLNMTSNRKAINNRLDKGLYHRLSRFELRLRQVFKDSGLEMKYAEDAKQALFKGGA